MNNYLDIINLEHYEPRFHERMSRYNRASQFASFAALKGFDELVEETARITERKIEISEEEKNILNVKLNYIEKNIFDSPKINVTYFLKDKTKDGGKYITISKNIKSINKIDRYIKFLDNTIIDINDIKNITGDLFKEYEK